MKTGHIQLTLITLTTATAIMFYIIKFPLFLHLDLLGLIAIATL